jgi:hypothetical protein
MTPLPLILLAWGLLLGSGILPNNILGIRLPQTERWRRIRIAVSASAILCGAAWLALDVLLPLRFAQETASHWADGVGWFLVAGSAFACALFVRRASDDRFGKRWWGRRYERLNYVILAVVFLFVLWTALRR